MDISNSVIDGLRNNPSAQIDTQDKDNALKQEDFFALLTQQLSYQDPTKPVENDQMISQMTNFTMADGISNLNTNFESFASSMNSNQALQASSLVGQQVLIPGDKSNKFGESGIMGAFETDLASHNTKMFVKDSNGQVVRTINMDSFPAGKHFFTWNGTNDNGEMMPDGEYQIQIQGRVGNESVSLPVSTYAHVHSVSLGANGTGLTINTSNGSVKLEEIDEIGAG